ncbi:MAG: hypothetical protein CEE42_06190 [Promethearchaeota archaeon Loki_b31]|nr:MAG: hypothetical protein CEE42_06190 [Candidatus Lokiarchaeota archaeon Loki_b31]
MSKSLIIDYILILFKLKKIINNKMFEEILIDFKEEKDNNVRHKSDSSQPLEKSIDYILDLINLDVVKILKYNRI